MKIGFDLSRLDDTTIRAMRRRLREEGVYMRVVVRDNDRYLCLDDPDVATGFERINLARKFYKQMNLKVVVWHEELGEYIDEVRFKALIGQEDELAAPDGDEFRENRDSMSGEHWRPDRDL